MRNLNTLLVALLVAGCGSTVQTFGDGNSGTTTSSTGQGGGDTGGESGVGGGGAGTSTATATSTSTSTSSGTGGNPPVEPINCGDQSCDVATEICCATFQGTNCIPASSNCMGFTLECSSAASCPGAEVCCASGSPMNMTATCGPKCEGGGPGPGGGGFQLCETDAECDEGEPCNDAFGGFKVCGN